MKNGFIFVEFLIALPLLILLLFSLGSMTLQIFQMTKIQIANYILETETQKIIKNISEDAKTAQSVKIKKAIGDANIYEIFFNYRTSITESGIITILKTPRRYTVGKTETHGNYIYRERLEDGPKVNPISGGNFFGDTIVTELKFSEPSENVLHISLEMQSLISKKKFKANTSVFMSACEEKIGL